MFILAIALYTASLHNHETLVRLLLDNVDVNVKTGTDYGGRHFVLNTMTFCPIQGVVQLVNQRNRVTMASHLLCFLDDQH